MQNNNFATEMKVKIRSRIYKTAFHLFPLDFGMRRKVDYECLQI